MKNIFDGHANKSGIYKIVNTLNGRQYFGSAKRFKQRASEHLNSLQKGTHHNKFLQNDFNKCGENVFEFRVVEVVEGTQDVRLLVEDGYVQKYHDDQEQCYNFMKQAKGKGRTCFSKSPEKTHDRLVAHAKANWANPEIRKKMIKNIRKVASTEEYKENLSVAQLASWKNNKKRKRATSIKFKKMWQDPEIYKRIHSTSAAEKRVEKLRQNSIEKHKLRCLNKKEERDFSYTGDATKRGNFATKNFKTFNEANLLSPGGVLYKSITNVQKFAEIHDLSETKVRDLIKFRLISFKGWIKYCDIEANYSLYRSWRERKKG